MLFFASLKKKIQISQVLYFTYFQLKCFFSLQNKIQNSQNLNLWAIPFQPATTPNISHLFSSPNKRVHPTLLLMLVLTPPPNTKLTVKSATPNSAFSLPTTTASSPVAVVASVAAALPSPQSNWKRNTLDRFVAAVVVKQLTSTLSTRSVSPRFISK